jgi:hypothetical protein
VYVCMMYGMYEKCWVLVLYTDDVGSIKKFEYIIITDIFKLTSTDCKKSECYCMYVCMYCMYVCMCVGSIDVQDIY